MIKNILVDYKTSFKDRWDYALQYGNASRVVPLMVAAVNLTWGEGKLVYYFVTIGLLAVCFFIGAMYQGYMNKPFYLCPIDRKERKRYLLDCYLLNLAIYAGLFLLVYIVMFLFHLVSGIEILCQGIAFMALMAINSIKIIYQKDVPKDCFCKDRNMGYYSLVKKSGFIIVFICYFALAITNGGKETSLTRDILLAIFTVIPAVYAFLVVSKYLPLMLSWNSEFEKCDRRFYDLELRKTSKNAENDW